MMRKRKQFSPFIVIAAIALVFSLGRPDAFGIPAPENYRFGKAEVMDRVILSVIENYYDPQRIDSMRMFKAIMDIFQKAVAELKVGYDEKTNIATVEIADASYRLSLSGLNSPWDLSMELHKLFKIIEQKLPPKEYDLLDLEYAAANAMLSTLDPHSNALPPDIYDYLRMDTAGEFGGLGIKITTDRRPPCRGNLTVVDVFDDTPAKRAGIKTGDRIVRIAGESTVNITTSEAADRLRGVPGTKVKVETKRQDGSVQSFTIEREMIPIKSVEWEMLDGNVGYINLKGFQENSAVELTEALKNLHAAGATGTPAGKKDMKGLILDLRGNPGGLLHIAIMIVDTFLPAGTIVTTAGRSEEDRYVENATPEHTEPMYPMVVLIDSTSASAAEIMAGALRNHGRALLVGETTFGKGSVQMVQQLPGGGAIKLTNSQYLTPGDISIQAVGVTPDITFIPVSVDQKEMDVIPNEVRFSEADLEYHLDRPNVRTRSDRSLAELAPLFVPKEERSSDRARYERCFVDEEEDRPFKGRYEKEFSRRLIAQADGDTAEELLLEAHTLLKSDNVDQGHSIEQALKKLHVDWSLPAGGISSTQGNAKGTASPRVSAESRILGTVAPGKTFKVKTTVYNGGKETIYRLRAATKSDNFYLTDREFVFGKLAPGKRASWTDEIKLPSTARNRVDDIVISYMSDSGPVPSPTKLEVTVPQSPLPRLTYAWQFQDTGNGDGTFSPGEEILMYLTVKNVGKGATIDAEIGLSAKPGIDLIQGQFDIGALAPNASANGVLKLRIADPYPLKEAKLNLEIREWLGTEQGMPSTRSLMDREIVIAVSNAGKAPEKASGTVSVQAGRQAVLRESPDPKSHVVALSAPDAAFKVDALLNGYYRALIGDHRQAWVAKSDVTPGGEPKPVFEPFLIEPPTITVNGPLVRRVKDGVMTLTGRTGHPVGVRDVMVFRGEQKILYLPADKKGLADHIDFSATIPLEAGANEILIVARHSDKVIGSQSVFVRYDSPIPPKSPK